MAGQGHKTRKKNQHALLTQLTKVLEQFGSKTVASKGKEDRLLGALTRLVDRAEEKFP